MKRLVFAFAFLLAPTALADQPTVTVDRGGVTVQSAQAVQVVYGDGFVRISWVPGPVVPTPVSPTPTPPRPVDPPAPVAPIAEPGLRVLIVYELSKLAGMPVQQFTILGSGPLREWMSQVCVKGQDGKMPEWRVYSTTADLSNETEVWRKAMARPRAGTPWIIVSNGKDGYEGPLPATADETRALIQRYVEAK